MDDEVRIAFSELNASLVDVRDRIAENALAIGKMQQSLANGEKQASTSRDWFKILLSIGMGFLTVAITVLALMTYLK